MVYSNLEENEEEWIEIDEEVNKKVLEKYKSPIQLKEEDDIIELDVREEYRKDNPHIKTIPHPTIFSNIITSFDEEEINKIANIGMKFVEGMRNEIVKGLYMLENGSANSSPMISIVKILTSTYSS